MGMRHKGWQKRAHKGPLVAPRGDCLFSNTVEGELILIMNQADKFGDVVGAESEPETSQQGSW